MFGLLGLEGFELQMVSGVYSTSMIWWILEMLHGFTILLYHSSEGKRYLGTCGIFRINCGD